MGAKGSKPETPFSKESNRVWLLKRRPRGMIKQADLDMEVRAVPTAADGEVVVRNTLVSIDPTHRIWMSDMKQYMPPVGLGETMRAVTLGEVVESKFAGLAVGDAVVIVAGVEDYSKVPGETANKVDLTEASAEDYMNQLGVIIGLTAFHGTMKICKPKKGEVFVVSGAAGAVGSIAGQLAKDAGAKVIGIVGSAAKGEWITKDLGFDGAINYKTDNIESKLAELAPEGVDCYFDNTGGPALEAVLELANNYCRIATCGQIDNYNTKKSGSGPSNYGMMLMRRVTNTGFICTDHVSELGDMLELYIPKLKAGKLKSKVDVREGLENYVQVVNLLFSGENKGKLLLRP